MEGIIIKETVTHKAIKYSDHIDIVEKGVEHDNEDMSYPDLVLYPIPLEQENNLQNIFDGFEEDNRTNMGWI